MVNRSQQPHAPIKNSGISGSVNVEAGDQGDSQDDSSSQGLPRPRESVAISAWKEIRNPRR
jgi:hypothetical protein